jgi:tetratricopeptide (TPR) repeat protein
MSDQKLSLDQLTEKAEKLEEAGSAREALASWREALKHFTTPYLLYRLGRLAMELEEWTEAEGALLQAVNLAPDFPGPYNSLGLLSLERGDYQTAQDYLKRGLAVEESAGTYSLLGTAQRSLGMTKAARWSYGKAVKIDPNYEEAYYNLALTYKSEQPDKALPLLEKAVALDPEYECAHRELGNTLRKLDKYPEAEDHLRRAIDLDDSDGWAYVYLGLLKWTTGHLAASEEAYKKAIETWPDNSLPYWCLAHFYEYQGRNEESESLYKKALEIDPDDAEANLRFGVYLRDIGEYSKAKGYLEHALSFDPNDERVKSALSTLR